MRINLEDIPVVYINLDSYPVRNQSMINMLEHYNFKYQRLEATTYQDINHAYDPIAKSHLKASGVFELPFVILEDDCIPFEYRSNIEVPDDADVIFLGVSSGTTNTHKPKYTKINEHIWRLYDMTTVHAILYLTEAGLTWLKQAYELTRNAGIGFDLATAKLMPSIKAYGLNTPLWYQKDLDHTQQTLDKAFTKTEYYGGSFPDYDKPYEF